MVNRFIEHSQTVTTNNYNSLTGLHTLKITVTTAHKRKSSMSAFASRCLVTNLSWFNTSQPNTQLLNCHLNSLTNELRLNQ
jgi:hypothetical protein